MPRPNKTGTPGVNLPRVKTGSVHVVKFIHPLTGKQRKASLGTTDGREAKRLASLLSDRLRSPSVWHEVPADSTIARVWGQCGEAVSGFSGKNRWPAQPATEARRSWMSPDDHRLLAKGSAENRELQKRFGEALEEIAKLRLELSVKNGLLRKMGLEPTQTVTLPLEDAATKYLDPKDGGHSGGKRYAKRLACDLKAFAEFAGEAVPVAEIRPEKVIEFVDSRIVKSKNGDQRPIGNDRKHTLADILTKFLEWSTGGAFRKQPVKSWLSRNCKRTQKTQTWIAKTEKKTDEKVNALIAALPERWQPVAYLQWVAGFRAEELARVQTKNLSINGKTGTCRIEPWGGWNLKNARATGTINLPRWSFKRLKPLLGTKTELLFTDEGKPWSSAGEERDREAFVIQYNEVLTAAAAKVGVKLEEKRPTNTLRRECGRRNLLQKIKKIGVGNAFEEVATILRNTPSVCRKHYASLLTTDVEQE